MRRLLLLAVLLLIPCAPRAAAEDEAKPQWIVVTAPAFREAIEELCQRREAQGFRVVRHVLEEGDAPSGLRAKLHALVRAGTGDSYVLLVGTMVPTGSDADPASVLPAPAGTVESMRGKPCDNAYGCLDGDLLPDVPVGRFPARTSDDVRAMVVKTIAFEEQRAPAAWRHRLTLLVGHPGGRSPVEKRLASYIVKNAIGSRFDQVHPQWRTRALVHMPSSPFCVPTSAIQDESTKLLEEGQLLSIYLGHCGAGGFWSDGEDFLRREDWATHDFGASMGIHLSCGCYTCQVQGWDGEGFAHAGMRNPSGPVAVVGAHGSSHGAMGKLAFEGLLPVLAAKDPPERLGAWWLAMKRGIAEGPISRLNFWLYDQADGSGGKVPLARQRLEHLEMWTLLGDPALRLPLEPLDVRLQVDGVFEPATEIRVRGTLPPAQASGELPVTVTVERPFGTVPPDLVPLPSLTGPERDRAMLARYAGSNDVTILSAEVVAKDGRFELRLTLPEHLPGRRLIVRARARVDEETSVRGAAAIPLAR